MQTWLFVIAVQLLLQHFPRSQLNFPVFDFSFFQFITSICVFMMDLFNFSRKTIQPGMLCNITYVFLSEYPWFPSLLKLSKINIQSFGLFYKLALDIHGQNKIVDLDFNLDAHYPNNGHTKCMHQSKCSQLNNDSRAKSWPPITTLLPLLV